MGVAITRSGQEVEVIDIRRPSTGFTIDRFDAVVIGASIHMSKHSRQLSEFVRAAGEGVTSMGSVMPVEEPQDWPRPAETARRSVTTVVARRVRDFEWQVHHVPGQEWQNAWFGNDWRQPCHIPAPWLRDLAHKEMIETALTGLLKWSRRCQLFSRSPPTTAPHLRLGRIGSSRVSCWPELFLARRIPLSIARRSRPSSMRTFIPSCRKDGAMPHLAEA